MGLAERFKEKFKKHKMKQSSDSGTISDKKDEISLFEQLKSDTLNKIYQTPYWQEYSANSKIMMIEKYLNAKIKRKSVQISSNDKKEFIDGVLAAAG